MPSPDLSLDAEADHIPAGLVEAGTYPTAAAGFEHGLVVLAYGVPYWLIAEEGRFRLLVEPAGVGAVRRQLECYDGEAARAAERAAAPIVPARPVELDTPLRWVTGLFTVFAAQSRWPAWTDAGSLDASAVFDRGEWWRVATALFLHADLGHVVSNALAGLLVFSAWLTTAGRRRGWALLAVASLAGNLAAAAARHASAYASVGASTAVFAGLGLLTGRAIRALHPAGRPWQWRPAFPPLASGLTVLGLYGAGGVEIDALAHLTGFVAGLALGYFLGIGRSDHEPSNPSNER